MRITDHLNKLSWSVADKALFVLAAVAQMTQYASVDETVWGTFALLLGLHTFLFSASDGFALQAVTKFGAVVEDRGLVNRYSLSMHTFFVMGLSVLAATVCSLFPTIVSIDFASVIWYLPLFSVAAIPRTYALNLLYRDIRIKAVFVLNLCWMGSMLALTLWYQSAIGFQTVEDLLLINISAMLFSSIVGIWLARREFSLRKGQGTLAFKTWLQFGLDQLGSSSLNNAVKVLDVFIVEAFFGSAIVGNYDMAKRMYRILDQGVDAVRSLFFPGSVRLYQQGRLSELHAMTTKMISFLFLGITFVCAAILIGAKPIVELWLPAKFLLALDHLYWLLPTTLILPFTMLVTLMVAAGATRRLLKTFVIATVIGLGSQILIGVMHFENQVALGQFFFAACLAVSGWMFAAQTIQLSPADVFRAIPDTLAWLRSRNKR